jgi:hypothetical protein
LQSRCGRTIWPAWQNAARNHRESLLFN